MKKLFLLLILSFFSAQSFAGSCPDGSDPVKSISADGTYFVYNCGGTSTKNKHHGVEHKLNTDTNDWHKFDTSITVGYTSSPPTQTYNYSSFDNIVDPYGRIISSLEIPDRWTNLKTPLMDIKIPEDWSLIDDYDRYQEIISRNAVPRLLGPWQNPNKYVCMNMLQNFVKFAGKLNPGSEEVELRVPMCLQDLRARLYEGDKDYVLDIFEYWAKQGLKQPKDGGIGGKDYDYFRILRLVAGVYAQEKDNIEFSDTFKAWLTDRLLNVELRSFETTNNTIYPRCRQNDFFTWGNDCSTTRFILTEAQLVGGLALGNQEIFDEGIDSLQYITTFFDDKNIFIRNASRGIRAMSYHVWIPTYLTNYAVVLDSVGYDFLEHEMPNGSKVHEAIKFSFDHVWEDDLSIFWPYIQISSGTDGNWTYPELLKPMHLRLGYSGFLPSKPQRVVRQSLFYVDKYQPELKDRFGYEEVYSKNVTGTEDFCDRGTGLVLKTNCVYSDLSWYAMFDIDSPLDMHSIYKASDKVFLAEQEACKASELDGEYIAIWSLRSRNQTQGSETLILDKCLGEFEGVESFQPSKELRKNLHVSYKTNGQITISGYLDLWDEGRSDFYVLEGDLNSGEISGRAGSDLIKIELIYKSSLTDKEKIRLRDEEALEKELAELEAQLEAEQEAARIAEEKRIAACKVSELNGEYIATWYLVDGQGTKNVNDNKEPDFQGSETLILDGCVGEFEGVESFQPSKELRKNLHVSYKPDGQITISGNLDLWEVGYSYPTVLKGDLNSGEISDFWWNGKDLIKIEITKVSN